MDYSVAREYYIIIKNQMAHTRFGAALASIAKLLEYFPEESLAYYYQGACLFVKSQYKEAIYSYKNAIKFDPDFAKAYFNMGVCFYVLGIFDDALINIAKAAKLFEKENDVEKRKKCIDSIKLIDRERKSSKVWEG